MQTNRIAFIPFFAILFRFWSLPGSVRAGLRIWANDGGDRVTQDDLRATSNAASVMNSVWDGKKINVFGARNEVVAFNLIIESPSVATSGVQVSFDHLDGPGDAEISSRTVSGNDVFDWVNRPIELFYVRYLEIKGLSLLSYSALDDERHVPKRFRRPWTGEGNATGTWNDRPDHNKPYPEIAVPLELVGQFHISADRNQSIWVDINIPKSVPTGLYQGTLTVGASSGPSQSARPPQC
jgi:hypothetical protein